MISPESQQINNVVAEKKSKKDITSRGKMDMTFFGMVMLLLTVGLVMLFSASYAYSYEYYGNSYKFITRQAAFAAAGRYSVSEHEDTGKTGSDFCSLKTGE